TLPNSDAALQEEGTNLIDCSSARAAIACVCKNSTKDIPGKKHFSILQTKPCPQSGRPPIALCRFRDLFSPMATSVGGTAQSGFLTADYAAALTSIFFSGFCAAGCFGSVTASTPCSKLGSIVSSSTRIGCCL